MTTTLEGRGPSAAPLVEEIRGDFLRLTTFRRDGTPVPTTVWFVAHGDELLVTTGANSGKVKRIRADAHVEIGVCSFRGAPRGAAYTATASILPTDTLARARALQARKYRMSLLFVRPIRAMQARRHPERMQEVVLSIRPLARIER
jgi:PPOX class probable F420-dependent enzyme